MSIYLYSKHNDFHSCISECLRNHCRLVHNSMCQFVCLWRPHTASVATEKDKCITGMTSCYFQVYCKTPISWWRHQIKTFSALLTLDAGNSPVTCEFPSQRPVTRSFDFFSNLRLNKRLSKQSWGLWTETPSGSLWRHCNDRTGSWCVVSHYWTITYDLILPPQRYIFRHQTSSWY